MVCCAANPPLLGEDNDGQTKKNCDDKESGEFEFKVFLTKRPEVYPNWDDPESDEEGVQSDVFFGMKVS